MANIKCNGKIETQTIDATKVNTQEIDVQGVFSALKNIGGGFEISDATNVGIELGRRDGTPGTPYIDFHTDGSSSTDYNARMLATGSQLDFLAANGLKINGKEINAIEESGDGYIRYVNGLQICWGNDFEDKDSTDYQNGSVTFPKTFASATSYAVGTTMRRVSSISYRDTTFSIRNLTSSGFAYQWYGQSYNSDRWQVQWIAIGKWK